MSIPTTMRALVQTALRGPQDLRLRTDCPVPQPGPGQILIKVAAAGVNFADISRGYGTFAGGAVPPFVAGFEAAGEIAATGDGETALEPGMSVVGVGLGAFAEYMVLPGAAVLPVPAGWTAVQAMGLSVNWPTALAALKLLGKVVAGETVLIHAAAGATGQAASCLAKHYGARVIATASQSKHELVRALGIEHVLDSRDAELSGRVLELTGGLGADLVLESAGGETFDVSLAAAKRVTGRVVVYGLAGGRATISNWHLVYEHPVHLIGLNIGAVIRAAPRMFGELMGELSSLIAAGVIRPASPTIHDLAHGPTLLQSLESRATTGKLALTP